MKLHILEGRIPSGYTTWGCIWKRGACHTDTIYQLTGETGQSVPMQSRVTAYWPDGSVKWTAHTANAEKLGQTIKVTPQAACSFSSQNLTASEGIQIQRTEDGLTLHTVHMKLVISNHSQFLFESLFINDRLRLQNAEPVLILERPIQQEGCPGTFQKEYAAKINCISVEEEGPLLAVIRYDGIHAAKDGEQKFPFIIRMKIGLDSRQIDFVHTFFYDGAENRDFLKGIGVRFHCPLSGALYNRHIKFQGDYGFFHEAAAQMLTWRPRLSPDIYETQMKGHPLFPEGDTRIQIEQALQDMPFWSEYDLCQDAHNHFSIRKKVNHADCSYLHCLDGFRTAGAASFGSENGSVLFAIKDFWEKYPSGYTFRGLDQSQITATVWLWSPKAEAFDFRHYASRGYSQVYYEGYDFKGADPYGIACTNEFCVACRDELIPGDEELACFSECIRHPAQYVGKPSYYHALRAFGYWSLPSQTTAMEQFLERQLNLAVDFYKNEVNQRSWYGMFHYGDFMHTYDQWRHTWRYDMGGYAWDNTELVPTLWLWLMFLRTGREDVFTLAEKLSRHTSEIDVYHFGPYQGMGSRHNVSHWGCPCKEARIAMAGHHRVYYYLTGDYRMGDIFEELKDNEETFLRKDPLEAFYDKKQMVYPSHARTGPDWSSLCANWLTRWERFGDTTYRDKIITGIADIKKAPLRLISGSDFEFDPDTVRLRYIGENATGGTHLQICMGAPQIWLELSDLLEDLQWNTMLAEYGQFYFLPREEQKKRSCGIIGDRTFPFPYMASAMGAYGAWYLNDPDLAQTIWRILLDAMPEKTFTCFQPHTLYNQGNRKELKEIPWISTNFTAQWCLNVITALDFIREYLPEDI